MQLQVLNPSNTSVSMVNGSLTTVCWNTKVESNLPAKFPALPRVRESL